MYVYACTGQPEVTVTPLWQTVEKSHRVTIIANAKGVGVESFRYVWIHNGRILPNQNNHMLVIQHVKEHNEGYYHCYVSNMYNDSVRSNKVLLNVRST